MSFIGKYIFAAAACIAIGFISGLWASKFFGKPIPPCPQCPPAAIVELQNFDTEKVKSKNFTYAPQMHNVTVRILPSDTAIINAIAKRINK